MVRILRAHQIDLGAVERHGQRRAAIRIAVGAVDIIRSALSYPCAIGERESCAV